MEPQNFTLLLKNAEGKTATLKSGEEKDGMRASLRTVALEGGYALYITASAEGGFDSIESIRIRPEGVKDTSRFLAIEAHSNYWSRPFWGASLSELPKRCHELFIEGDGSYTAYLGAVDSLTKTVVQGYEGGFELRTYTNDKRVCEVKDQLAFIVMHGTDPLALAHDIAKKVADLLGRGLKMREERVMPEVFEYLGWCSWDAMQTRVSHSGMVEKALEFRDKGVPIHFAILDDMWAHTDKLYGFNHFESRQKMFATMHQTKLAAFEGDPLRFPLGVKAMISDLKEIGIPHVGVWFPTTGYWLGITDDGEIAKTLGEHLVETVHEGVRRLTVKPTVEAATAVYGDFCARVREWGGDLVKIDNQGCHMFYENLAPIGESSRALQSAIEAVTEKEFGGALINCMGMPSECMFNRPDSAISRCSDDFVPEDRAWFSKNMLQSGYNGLLQGQYYINDWDMWWTDDDQAAKNSLVRSISGGPIYVSDMMGRTRPALLKPLTYCDGRIPRPRLSATPTADCLMENPTLTDRPMKLRNLIGRGGVIAAFNLNAENRPVCGTVAPTEAGLPEGRYAFYEHFSGAAGILEAGEALPLALENNDVFALYSFIPMTGKVAAVGRTDLYMGLGAVEAADDTAVTVTEGGRLAFISEAPVRVFSGDEELPTTRTGVLTVVKTAAERVTLRLA